MILGIDPGFRTGCKVAVDSTEPDLDHGQIGRGRYRWIEEQFAQDARLRVSARRR